MLRPGNFFGQVNNGNGNLDVTVPTRSAALFCPALSKVCVHFAAGTTGSVDIISNPFDVAAKDKILTTITASGQYAVPTADVILLNVTAIAGTISARVIYEQEVE